MKKKTLTLEEYIDGRNELINTQKEYDERTKQIEEKDHFRVVNVKIRKNTSYSDIPNTIPVSELVKPSEELIKESGGIEKCKWVLHKDFKSKYEEVLISAVKNHMQQQNITLIDCIFYDTIYEVNGQFVQYYEGFARGIDNKTANEVGLKPLKMTERQKKAKIKKTIKKIDEEWQLKKI